MVERAGPAAAGEVTRLLQRLHAGEREVLDRLFPLVYDQLRAAADHVLRGEFGARPLQPTELVHEAYLKLVPAGHVAWESRAHFLAVAARAMRQVLVEQARRQHAGKRGGGARHVTLGDDQVALGGDADELLALDDALERLEPRLRAVVEHRFFGGLTERETAEVLGVTERTVQRDWVRARAWLYKEIYPADASGGGPVPA